MALAPPPPRSSSVTDDNFHWLDAEDGRQAFEEQARELLGITGEEFLRRLDAGVYDDVRDDIEHRDVTYLSLLADLVR